MKGKAMRQEYTLSEVAKAMGMTERNVRAYRTRGLIQPPRMRGRVGYYGPHHLAQLRLVQALLGRGLNLSVIAQLVQRGVAQSELARIVREELQSVEPVPLSQNTFQTLERGEPGLVEHLADLGLGERTPTGYRSDPALFALSNLLVSLGLPQLDVARISQRAAECAQEVVTRLPDLRGSDDDPQSRQHIDASVVELAATAFRMALSHRLAQTR